MVIDSSAIVAILLGEPERENLWARLLADPRRLIAAPTFVEASMVLQKFFHEEGPAEFLQFLELSRIEVVPFDRAQALLANEAFRLYGKGRHPARLNMGDCFSYALAKHTGEPLLFKGEDFRQTDLRIA